MADKSRNTGKGIALAGLGALASCVSPERGLEKLAQQPSQPPVAANGRKPNEVDYSTKVADKYLARIGVIFADEPVIQNSLTYSNNNLPGLSLNYWENRLLGNGELTETDLTLRYGLSRENFDFSVKADYVFLDAFTSFRDALEIGASVSTRNLPVRLGGEIDAIFSPDNSRYVGFEYILSARKDVNLIGGLSANAWGDVHFNSHYFTPDSTFSVTNIGAGLNWDIFRNGLVNLGVSGQQQYTLGDNFEDQSLVGVSVGGSVKF